VQQDIAIAALFVLLDSKLQQLFGCEDWAVFVLLGTQSFIPVNSHQCHGSPQANVPLKAS